LNILNLNNITLKQKRGQTWDNILDILTPFKNEPKFNLTKILIDNKYTPLKMFKVNILCLKLNKKSKM